MNEMAAAVVAALAPGGVVGAVAVVLVRCGPMQCADALAGLRVCSRFLSHCSPGTQHDVLRRWNWLGGRRLRTHGAGDEGPTRVNVSW